MRKYILKHTQMTNTFGTEIIFTQLHFILGRAEIPRNYSSMLKDAPDIHRFFNSKWVLCVLLEIG